MSGTFANKICPHNCIGNCAECYELENKIKAFTHIEKEVGVDISSLRKKLKALEIIKEKISVFMDYSINANHEYHYHIETTDDVIPLTKEEYELLKEIFHETI